MTVPAMARVGTSHSLPHTSPLAHISISVLFMALFRPAGLLEQAGVSMRRLPKEVVVYLMTSPSAPFCGK